MNNKERLVTQGDSTIYSRRRELGIYYTPQDPAALLSRWAIRSKDDRVLEPSFGGCSLLNAAYSRFNELEQHHIGDRLIGYDIDPSAFDALTSMSADLSQSSFLLKDFLDVRPRRPLVNVVIANPPFVSYRAMSQQQRKAVTRWRLKYAQPLAKDAGLWAYFLYHTLNFLSEGGRIAFILPAAATASDYSKEIHQTLARNFRNIEIYKVNERIFSQTGTVEKISFLFADGYKQGASGTIPVLEVQSLEELKNHIDGTTRLVSLLKEPELLEQTALSKIVKVSIGEVVGDVSFFVRSPADWDAMGIQKNERRYLLRSSKNIEGLQIRKKDLSSLSQIWLPPQSPSEKTKNILASYPKKNRSTFQKRDYWYRCSYDTTAAGFISSISGEYLRLVVNQAQISCTNGWYKIFINPTAEITIEGLALAFQTSSVQLQAEKFSRTMGAGGLKLEPSDVLRIAIPNSIYSIPKTQIKNAFEQVDSALRSGKHKNAREIADRAVLLDTQALSKNQLEKIRTELDIVRAKRVR